MLEKILLLLLLVGGCAGYIWITQSQINSLTEANSQLKTNVSALEKQLEKNEESQNKQKEELSRLQKENNIKAEEITRYLSIFQRHDFNKLAEAKPGLIERRVNEGTAQVFKEIESETSISSSAASGGLFDFSTKDNN